MKTRKLNYLRFAFSLIILFNLLTGCQSSFESKIQQKFIIDSKTHIKVIFPLKELTDFEWDKFYAFDSNCSQEDINKALGFEYPYYKESCRTLVFIKDEKIAYHEENPSEKENDEKGVIFMHSDSIKFYSCTHGHSYIRVEEKPSGKQAHLELFPLQ